MKTSYFIKILFFKSYFLLFFILTFIFIPIYNVYSDNFNYLKGTRIEINLPSRQLTLYQDDKVVVQAPVAIGSRRFRTPIGPRALERVIINPWWFPPNSGWAENATVTSPGPKNPLGKIKIPLGGKILLHGTSKPQSVGRAVSHGCMRMHYEDLAFLAEWLIDQHTATSNDDYAIIDDHLNHWHRRSHTVNLLEEIPVLVRYQTVEVVRNHLVFHPDVYNRHPDINNEVLQALEPLGILASEIFFDQVPTRLPKEGSLMIPILNFLERATPPLRYAWLQPVNLQKF